MTDSRGDILLKFYRSNKRMPSYSEMMSIFGFKSKNAVSKVISKLIDIGVITKDSTGRIIPNVSVGEVPLLGLVKAGFPSDVGEASSDTLSIDEYLVQKPGESYMLEVDGDSMIDAHIASGDMVIAERTSHARDGDIVIAQIDEEWTMKYLREKNGKRWLEPANNKFKPMHPEFSLHIAARVTGVIRKL